MARAEPTARERLAGAAFAMFAAHGFDETTVEEITDAAGVSRRTFFRHFPTKEDVIFPDHDRLRALVADQLEFRRNEPPLSAVCNAVRLVLTDYVEHREVSLHRFALTRQVTALREREVTSVHAYQRMFVRYLRDRLGDGHELRAELMAAAVVAAHNATLREWLRSGGRTDPVADLDAAFAVVQDLFTAAGGSGDATPGTGVAVFRTDLPVAEVLASVERALAGPVRSTKRAASRRRSR